ncbi:MAG: beta-mannosidase [Chitinispirillia bacterium]|nr:beta-mannosidase [Chitinispirillia bacterium]MCL2241844.1 beta-mannosidase [Chitinispirillia bacterium]
MRKNIIALSAAIALSASAALAAGKYEAEAAGSLQPCSASGDAACTVADAAASGGSYVNMRAGSLTFNVSAPTAGFYTIWTQYSQTCDDSKVQNLVVNNAAAGTMTFPMTGPYNGAECGPASFQNIKAAGKVKLNAGANTVAITNSWGWVSLDYIEVGPYVPAPFTVPATLVTPNASDNTRKMYRFLRENFQKKIISGVMTDNVMQNDGKYTAHTHTSQPEMKNAFDASGKYPALIGLDFMHGTGEQANRPNGGGDWFTGYNNATIALAETFFKAGGIPIYCWHWRDPLRNSTHDQSFYTKETTFDLTKAFTNSSYDAFNTSSPEYIAMLRDIDEVAGFLKTLADKDVPVLWRPLHEAAGGWFWWGAKGPKPCAQLWRLMFDRMVNHHKLNNLIWVWTTEESGRELEWYPGDEYADIIGRDYYPPNNQQARATGSLVSNFENIKEIFGANKIIALSENGSIPYPDSLAADGAEWSWFMSWNGQFATQVNTAADWNHIMNHNYVITLAGMPGWDKYDAPANIRGSAPAVKNAAAVSVRGHRGVLELRIGGTGARSVELFNMKGAKIAVLSRDRLTSGNYRFPVRGVSKQMSVVRVRMDDNRVVTIPVRLE